MSKRIVISIIASVALSLGGWLASCGSKDRDADMDLDHLVKIAHDQSVPPDLR